MKITVKYLPCLITLVSGTIALIFKIFLANHNKRLFQAVEEILTNAGDVNATNVSIVTSKILFIDQLSDNYKIYFLAYQYHLL